MSLLKEIKIFSYAFMRQLCWWIEDIYDFIFSNSADKHHWKDFYISAKWEDLYVIEKYDFLDDLKSVKENLRNLGAID